MSINQPEIALPPDPGSAGWNSILPPRTSTPELTEHKHADFLIIGAGFAGLTAARRLQQLQPDASIVVLEGSAIAEGPAGRNSGFMIDLPHDLSSEDYAGNAANDQRQTAINRAAIRFAHDAAREYHMPEEAAVASGKINAAATRKGIKHNTDYAKHLDALGEEYRFLDSEAMQQTTGIDYYRGGLWTPGTTILQPALYIRGLADGLLHHNTIDLYEHSPVTRLQKQSSATPSWHATTPQGSVTANNVILAVNGLVQQFGYYPRQLMHIFTYASMTRTLTPAEDNALGGEKNWSFTPADPLGTTVRRVSGVGGSRIVIRNRFTYDPSMQVSKARMHSVTQSHIQSFQARFPMLREVSMEYSWGGRLCLSLNNVSVIGGIDNGLFSACCQNGLGTAKGTVAGIIAAEQACQSEETLIPEYLPEPKPRRLWPEPFMYLGANGYMKFKEWQAGKEF